MGKRVGPAAASPRQARGAAVTTASGRIRRALVIAPHADDEVLGCGGVLARLAAEGAETQVAIVTQGGPPRFDPERADVVRAEALAAHRLLGVAHTHFIGLPAAELDRVPHAELNEALRRIVAEAAPDTLFLPFVGDLHLDHQLVFRSALVAARPAQREFPMRLYAYETLSETNWHAAYVTPGFLPNTFIDIGAYLERKLDAFRCFRSQVQAFPHERSIDALRALAVCRGAAVHRGAAEAFVLLREVG